MKLNKDRIKQIYLFFSSMVGAWMLAEALAYYKWGLNSIFNDLTVILFLVDIPASIVMLFIFLQSRQISYTLSPLIFLSTFGFSFLFCPEEGELAILDWRMLVEYGLAVSYSLVSIWLLIRLPRQASSLS